MLSRWNKGENVINSLFSHFFLVPQKKWNISEAPQKKSENKNYVIFHFNYFRMLGTGWVNKVFSPRIFINIFKKMVTNMKFAFINVHFWYISACIIQKWLRFKRVIQRSCIATETLFEHLAVPFIELVRGGSCVSHLCFFCLHRITCLSIPTVTQT